MKPIVNTAQITGLPTKPGTMFGGLGTGVSLRRLALASMFASAVLLMVLLMGVSTADASRSYLGSFGSTGTLGGQFNATGSPRGVAVNYMGNGGVSAGTIYVVDFESNRVQRFTSTYQFISTWGQDVVQSGKPSDTGTGFETCSVASECKAGTIGAQGGALSAAQGIAVNQATGNLYITNRGNRRIDEFSSTGTFLRAWGWDVVKTGGAGDDEVIPINEFEICTVASDCQQGSSGGGAGQLATNTAIPQLAVDSAGNVYLPDAGNMRVQKFTESGTFISAFGWDVVQTGGTGDDSVPPINEFEICTISSQCKAGIAGTGLGQFGANMPIGTGVDSAGNVYVNDQALVRVQKFSPSLEPLSAIAPGGGSPLTLGVDPTGSEKFIVSAFTSPTERRIRAFDAVNSEVETLLTGKGIAAIPNLGYNPVTQTIFASTATGGNRVLIVGPAPAPMPKILAPTEISATSARFNGTVAVPSPGGEPFGGSYRFEYSGDNGLTWTKAPSVDMSAGTTPVSVSQKVAGLEANRTYRVRLFATTGDSAASSDEIFTTSAARPTISNVVAESVTGSTAKLIGFVNPNNANTSYRFEWGLDTTYGHQIPTEFDAFIGSSGGPIKVSANLSGLNPHTIYFFRLMATNSSGITIGSDHQFVTLNAAGLPNNRGFELVSPADKRPQGEIRDQLTSLFVTFQATGDGQSVIFPYLGALDSNSGGDASYMARRSSAGWQSEKISPPSMIQAPTNGLLGNASAGIVSYYSRDLSCGVVNTFNPLTDDTPSADVELGLYNLYRRNPDGTHTLLTNTVPSNPEIQAVDAGGFPVGTVAGASPDCSKVYFHSRYSYLPDASGLYEWDNGTLRDAGRLPSGANAAATIGPLSEVATGPGGDLGLNKTGRLNSVSTDGSRFFFSARSDEIATLGVQAVFAREDGGSVEVSRKRGGARDSLGSTYQGASPDGSHVFFTSGYGLTPASSSGPAENCANPQIGTLQACDLYDYDVVNDELTNLSADSNSADTKGAVVQGVLAISDDGSSVYFAARGQLIPGEGRTYAQNTAGAGSANVYLASGNQLSYVSTITVEDLASAVIREQWSSEATPDGGQLLFASTANITGYDSGGVREAYLYSAQTETTVCISCRRDGLPSVGDSNTRPLILSFPQSASRQADIQKMSDDGSRIFFSMPDVLAPGAVAGNSNLYEWEEGQIYFLATGAVEGFLTANATQFYGTSATGDDVFIHTPEQLDPTDTDFVQDIYDIRVNGGFSPPGPPGEVCNPAMDQCQGTPAQQPQQVAPASAGFAGHGNPPPVLKKPKPCKKKPCSKAKKGKKKNQKRNHSRAANPNGGGVK